MKKTLLFVLLAMCLGMRAQDKVGSRWYDYDRKNYMGIRLGASVAQMFTQHVPNASTHAQAGWNAGVVAGHQLGRGVPLFVEAGLMYTQKCVTAKFHYFPEKHDLSLGYIEMPVAFKYKISLPADDLTLQPFFGGFWAVGVGGKDRSYVEHKKYDVFHERGFKRIDAGLRMGCALAYQNLYLEVVYDLGLVNIADGGAKHRIFEYDEFDNRIRTGCFCVSIGLDF